ncbi:MAG: hypothetical protein DRQ39_04360, partial [Gammaproteobacteria bacterium]
MEANYPGKTPATGSLHGGPVFRDRVTGTKEVVMGARIEGGQRTGSSGVATALNTAGQRTTSSAS